MRRRYRLILSITLVLFVAALAGMGLVARYRAIASRVPCAHNLHQIGLAVYLYAKAHAGTFPDSFDTLQRSLDVKGVLFRCPAENELASGTSYSYTGRGLTFATATADTVVAFERRPNHGRGVNMLFGDGHAEFVDAERAGEVTRQVATGTFPITLRAKSEGDDSSTRPATQR